MNSERYKILTVSIFVVSFLIYSFTLYTDDVEGQKGLSLQAANGKMIWQEKNCTACHQIYGLGGHLGPDLTNVSQTRSKAYIEVFLRNGTEVMPNFHLTDQEIADLQSYLESLNQTGNANPTHFKRNFDGTITQ